MRRWLNDDSASPLGNSPNEGASFKSDVTVCSSGSNAADQHDVREGVRVSQPGPASATKSTRANVTPDRVLLGIACMAKKLSSPTMQSFIRKFESFEHFSFIFFSEDLLLNEPVDSWPHVDCAIMFYSKGFPLDKACEYFHRHKRDTYFLTEPESQKVLLDRRDFYEAMSLNNIPLPPNHVFCNRDGYRRSRPSVVEEGDDYIIVDGHRLDKPFVEKPVYAEDHAIFIYYPKSQGGGCRQMFRKVNNKSSEYVAECNRVRREGSYVYESFVRGAVMDIKCYTVGPNFVHAEARKAPTVDGIVERDANGKEIRVTVPLLPAELMVARKVIKVFRQMVCGFDILRANNTDFYVCDVNGWSFVKNNQMYVDRAATIMRDIFLKEVGKRGLHRNFRRVQTPRELMGVVGVFRHADRTPKQKLKLNITSKAILRAAFGEGRSQRDEISLKGSDPKLEELQDVLEAELAAGTMGEQDPAYETSPTSPNSRCRREVLQLMRDVLARRHEGLKIQVKPKSFDEQGNCVEAQLVCKWGGWITRAGERQAQNVGQNFIDRVFGHERSALYLRDVQVSSNNERRVLSTARIFVDFVVNNTHTPTTTVDEPLLGDNTYAKDVLEQINTQVSEIMHCDDPARAKDMVLKYPGMDGLLQNFVLTEDERTPLKALHRLYSLVAAVVEHVCHRWTDPNASLHRGEPLSLLRQRWSNLLKSLVLAHDPIQYDVTKLTDVFDYVSYDVCYNQKAFKPIDLYPLFTLSQSISAFVAESENGLDSQTKFLTGSLIGEPLIRRVYSDLVAIARGTSPRTRLYFTSASHVNAVRNVLYNNNATSFHSIGFTAPLELHFLSHFVFKVYRYPRQERPSGTLDAPPTPNRSNDALPMSELSAAAVNANSFDSANLRPFNPVTPPGGINGGERDVYQIEVHFSTGVDKNMFGIVQGHHAQYGAVMPMIRIHNNLTFGEFLAIVKQCQHVFEQHTKLTLPAVQEHGGSLSTPHSNECFPRCLSPNTLHVGDSGDVGSVPATPNRSTP